MPDADDRLGAQMEDRIDLERVERALERPEVLEVAVHDGDALDVPAPVELGPGIGVEHQRDDVGAPGEQVLHEPGPDHPRGAGDEHAPVRPERGHSRHTCQGARPPSHRLSSSFRSRRVSMHCQKPPWRKATSWPSFARRSSGSRSR